MRARHENGKVTLTAAKTWKATWHVYIRDEVTGIERRTSRSKIVGTKAEMRKFEAEEELSKLVAAVNVAGSIRDPRITFGWFYDNRFKPVREGGWGPATQRGNTSDVETYIRPYLGELSLSEMDLFKLQTWLNTLAKEGGKKRGKKDADGKVIETRVPLSESVVLRCLTLMRSVFGLAVEMDLLTKNPAKRVTMPVCKPTQKPVLTEEELRRLFRAVADDRDRLILMIGAFCAVTSSELFGLTWDCYKGDEFEIRNTAYRGELHEWRVKKKVRFRRVHIAPALQAMLTQWQSNCSRSKNCSRSLTTAPALIFPGKNGPLCSSVFLQKRVRPIAKALGITSPVTFQVLRRSAATRNQKNGSLKDVQTLLGHSNIETTGNVYMQAVPQSVREMVDLDVRTVLQKDTTGYSAKKQPVKTASKLLN